MTKTVSATDARANFAEILDRVLYAGEEFIVHKQGKPAAIIMGIKKRPEKRKRKRLTGTEFLLKLSKYGLKKGPQNLAQDHDKYTWE